MYLFRKKNTSIPNQLNMELALFMDSSAYSILTEVLDHQELVDVTFSVINQVRPSLYYVGKKTGWVGSEKGHFSFRSLSTVFMLT